MLYYRRFTWGKSVFFWHYSCPYLKYPKHISAVIKIHHPMKNQSSLNVSETLIVYLIAAGLLSLVMTIAYIGWQP
jgi:hypothetical protein